MATPKTAMTFDVYLWNDDAPDDPHHHRVVTGVRERLRAKMHFKKPIDQVLTEGNEEGMAYLAYLGCQRYGIIEESQSFETFVDSLFAVDPEGLDELSPEDVAAALSQDDGEEGDADGGRDGG